MSAPGGGPTRPRLVAVPPSEAPGDAPAPRPGEAAGPGRGSRWIWVLAALLALCFGGLAVEARRAAQLAERLAASEARLQAAEARLSAYDAYLGAVRSRVGALRDQIRGLEGVLAADPAQGAPRE